MGTDNVKSCADNKTDRILFLRSVLFFSEVKIDKRGQETLRVTQG
jgi:hypothetical protein